MKHRPMWQFIALMAVTFGFYGFYVVPSIGEGVNRVTGEERFKFWITLIIGIVTFGIGVIVLEVLMARQLGRHSDYTAGKWSNKGIGRNVLIANIVMIVVGCIPGALPWILSWVAACWAIWMLQRELNRYLALEDSGASSP